MPTTTPPPTRLRPPGRARPCRVALLAATLGCIVQACGGEATGDAPDALAKAGCTNDDQCPAATDPCKRAQCGLDGACVLVEAAGATCDDGEPCTVGDHCVQGACEAGTNFCGCDSDADCAPLGDGDPCNGTLTCDKVAFPPRCRLNPATIVKCKKTADGPCQLDACDPKTGKCALLNRPDGTPCDDGSACTVDERCAAGACGGGTDLCGCGPDKPCDDDGDACNGTLYCDTSKPPWVCRLNPGSVVTCSAAGDTACAKNLCDKATGQCKTTALPDGTACEDGNPCTENDACAGGACEAGSEAVCKCKTTADCAAQEDGDQCNGTLFCNTKTSLCELNPATVVSCPTVGDTPCLKNACFPKTGLCQPTPIEKLTTDCDKSGCVYKLKPPQAPAAAPIACDDGNACTKGEVCQGGQCASGSVVCFCKEDGDCVDEDDGDLCNGTLFCNKQQGKCELNPASVVKCPSVGDTLCLKNLCAKKTGQCQMTAVNDNKLCDDDNPCTVGDLCQSGKCKPGTNTCACWLDADCASKEDGNACNGTLYCDKSGPKPKCVLNPASEVVCNKQPDSPCLQSVCDPVTGKCVDAPTNAGGQCDDGSACTKGDGCKGGACLGKPVSCDDANPCTIDACKPATGCVHALNACSDGNACTADVCDVKTGKCAFEAKGKEGMACDADSDGCTLNDHCAGGVCVAGVGVVCEQGAVGACEQVLCSSTGPSKHVCLKALKPKGAACEDGDPCTVGSVCVGGKCSGAAKQRYFVKVIQPPLAQGALLAVAPRPGGGGLVFAGWSWAGPASKPQQSAWWLLRADEAGDAVWQDKVIAPVGHAEQRARALWVSDAGAIFVAGAVGNAAGELDAMLARWGDKPGAQWSKKLGTVGADEVALAMKIEPLGTSVLAGWRATGGKRRGWAAALGANEQQVWTWQDMQAGDGQIEAVAGRPDGSWLLAGHRLGAGGKRRAALTALSAQGVTLWQTTPGGDDRRPMAALLRGDQVVLAGRREGGGTHKPWLAAVGGDATGATRWEHAPETKARIAALMAVEKDRMVQAGAVQPLGGKWSAWVAGLDALGNTRWSRALQEGDTAEAHALASTADGGVVVAGQTGLGGKARGLAVRLDPWGHASCAEAGKCLGMEAGKCADSDPCTVELCDGQSGCKVALVEKLLCDPADGCSGISACSQGKCPATPQGRLYAHTWALPGKASLARVVPMPGGGYAFAGQVPKDGGHAAMVARVGADGALLWWAPYKPNKAWWMGLAVQPTSDGGVILAAQGTKATLRRYKADGTVVWTHDWPMFQSHLLHDLARYPDGTYALVLQVSESSHRFPRVYKINEAATIIWKGAPIKIPNFGTSEVFPVAPKAGKTATGKPLWAMRAAVHATGEVTLAGAVLPKGGAKIYAQPWMARVSAGGAKVWQHGYGYVKDGLDDLMYDATATPDGGVLAAGARTVAKTGWEQGYLLRVDDKGQKLWDRFMSSGGRFEWGGVAPLADGGFVVVGQARILGVPHHHGIFIDAAGNTRWSRTWPGAGRLSSVAPLPGGDLLIGGPSTGSDPKALVLRTNAWGHAGCAAAGACAPQKLNTCDDADPCTADACEAAKGCVHVPISGCKAQPA